MKSQLRDTRTLLEDVNEFLHIPPIYIDRCGWNLISAYCGWTVLLFMILVHWNPCFIEEYKWSLHFSSKFFFQLRWHSVQKNSTGVRYVLAGCVKICAVKICCTGSVNELMSSFATFIVRCEWISVWHLYVVCWTCVLSTWVRGRSCCSYGSKLSYISKCKVKPYSQKYNNRSQKLSVVSRCIVYCDMF